MNGHIRYELAKMRLAELHHWADQQRLARQARDARKAEARHAERQGNGFSLRRLIISPRRAAIAILLVARSSSRWRSG